MSKIDDLVSEMRSDPIRYKENFVKEVGNLNSDSIIQSKYAKLLSEMKENTVSQDNLSDSKLKIPEEEMNKIRETIFKEQMQKLKEENPSEYYRVRAGFTTKTTSKKSKRKHRKKHT